MAGSETGFVRRGEPWVWVTAAALATLTLLAVSFVVIILTNALGFYWPDDLVRWDLADGRVLLGEVVERDEAESGLRYRLKIGNRDLYGQDFVWIDDADITARSRPADAIALERAEYGNFYGFLVDLEWPRFRRLLEVMQQRREDLQRQQHEMTLINRRAEVIRRRIARESWRIERGEGSRAVLQSLQQKLERETAGFATLRDTIHAIEQRLRAETVRLHEVGGRVIELPWIDIMRAWRPNRMSTFDKLVFYAGKCWELLTGEPRESNTEGGLFPAIFGTVMMVLLMSLFAIPFGVVAAIYLHEYAREGRIVTLVRVSVNNLAGVPSIVYGVFGLGFFIYTVGAAIDQAFFPYLLPTPTFGTGGILWASLTLALLTVPVVIVATEEALAAIPASVREGSLALGATRFQTLVRILLPMSTPGILTGLILAMARAAGEVAPLMLTGAVKMAPDLPLDSIPPYLHLDRKFMHLGFHIYDLGFQSPNVEAVLPMVYVTTALLLTIVITLSGLAILLRNRMRRRYITGVF